MNKYISKVIYSMTVLFSFYSFQAQAAEFSLFGDVKLNRNTTDVANDQFSLGGLDFYATQELDEKSRGFVEYVLENTPDGLVTDLERIWISHTVSEELTIAAGRFHTPLGVWNRTFHHGAYMQPTVSRPFFLDFEDGAAGILPVHIVGLMAWGELAQAWGDLNYELFIANGPSINTSIAGLSATPDNKPEIDINASGDANNNKAFGGRLTAALNTTPVTLSAFFYNSSIGESGTGSLGIQKGGTLIDQLITGIDINVEMESFSLLAEIYNLKNDSFIGDKKSHDGQAFFVQGGWRFNETTQLIARYESMDFDGADSYFRLLGVQEGKHEIIAIRHELTETNALKLEANVNDPNAGASDTTYTLEWSFMIP